MNILVADESSLIRQVIRRILKLDRVQANVIEAESTDSVLEKLNDYKPEYLIIDAGGFKISTEIIATEILAKGLNPSLILISQFPPAEVVIPPGMRHGIFLRKEELSLISKMIGTQ